MVSILIYLFDTSNVNIINGYFGTQKHDMTTIVAQ